MHKSIDGIRARNRAQGGATGIDTGNRTRGIVLEILAAAVLLPILWVLFCAFTIAGQSITGEYCYYNQGVTTCE